MYFRINDNEQTSPRFLIDPIKNMRKLRRNHRLTQEAVADLLGCSRKRVNRTEQGVIELSVGELLVLAKSFNTPFHEFLGVPVEQLGVKQPAPKKLKPVVCPAEDGNRFILSFEMV